MRSYVAALQAENRARRAPEPRPGPKEATNTGAEVRARAAVAEADAHHSGSERTSPFFEEKEGFRGSGFQIRIFISFMSTDPPPLLFGRSGSNPQCAVLKYQRENADNYNVFT